MEDSDSESNTEESSDEEWQPRLHPNDWRYAGRKYAVTKPNKKGKQTEVDVAQLKTVYGEGYVTSAEMIMKKNLQVCRKYTHH